MQKGKTLRHRIRRSRARGAFRFSRKELIGQAPELPDLRGRGPGDGNKLRSAISGRVRVSQALVWAELFQSGDVPSTIARATEHGNKQTPLDIERIPSHDSLVHQSTLEERDPSFANARYLDGNGGVRFLLSSDCRRFPGRGLGNPIEICFKRPVGAIRLQGPFQRVPARSS